MNSEPTTQTAADEDTIRAIHRRMIDAWNAGDSAAFAVPFTASQPNSSAWRIAMTPKQVALVQDSFAKVALTSEAAAVLFYDRLFDIAPQMKAMFPDDMIEQRRKLMAMLAGVVKGLGNLEQVLPVAGALAKRHVSYGAKAEHYRWSAPRCCGCSRRAWGMAGRRKWRTRGTLLMARCPAI